jgi:hypothetical protein
MPDAAGDFSGGIFLPDQLPNFCVGFFGISGIVENPENRRHGAAGQRRVAQGNRCAGPGRGQPLRSGTRNRIVVSQSVLQLHAVSRITASWIMPDDSDNIRFRDVF